MNTDEDAFTDGTGGGLVYWTIIRSGQQHGAHAITMQKSNSPTAPEGAFDSTDKVLEGVFTAWDLKEDCCAQVLGWKGQYNFAALQFRYGARTCVIETTERHLSLYGACFAGLNNKLSIGRRGSRAGAVMSALGEAAVYFCEPFGRKDLAAVIIPSQTPTQRYSWKYGYN